MKLTFLRMCDQFLGEKLGLQDTTETQNLDI